MTDTVQKTTQSTLGRETQSRMRTQVQPLSPHAHGLKMKVVNVNNSLAVQGEELDQKRVMLDGLKTKKASNPSQLDRFIKETQKSFVQELARIEDDFHLQCGLHKTEQQRLQQQITTLKSDKTSVHQQVIAIQRRVEEIEEEIGHD